MAVKLHGISLCSRLPQSMWLRVRFAVKLRCTRAEINKIKLMQYKARERVLILLGWDGKCCPKKNVTSPLLLGYVTGLFRICRLTCKREHFCSFCKCRHLIRNIALTRIWTLNRIFCTATHTVNDRHEPFHLSCVECLSPLQPWSSPSLISTALHLFRLAS